MSSLAGADPFSLKPSVQRDLSRIVKIPARGTLKLSDDNREILNEKGKPPWWVGHF
jgi:hypothetical protein